MSDGFSIGAAMDEPSIFECQSCRETIDASAETCRFCGVKVDREAARQAAVLLARINQACSDASYMRSTALTLPVFFLIRFVPFIANVGSIGFVVLLFVLPGWAMVWLYKYAGIATDDAEFLQARRRVKIIGLAVFFLLVLAIVVSVMMLRAAHPARGF